MKISACHANGGLGLFTDQATAMFVNSRLRLHWTAVKQLSLRAPVWQIKRTVQNLNSWYILTQFEILLNRQIFFHDHVMYEVGWFPEIPGF